MNTENLNISENQKLSYTPLVLREGFDIKERMKKVNKEVNPILHNSYESLSPEVNFSDKMKKFLYAVSIDDEQQVVNLLQQGFINKEMLNSSGAFSLQIAMKLEDTQIFKTLVEYGANPNLINPKDINDPNMREIVEQEQYKFNNPIASLFIPKKMKI